MPVAASARSRAPIEPLRSTQSTMVRRGGAERTSPRRSSVATAPSTPFARRPATARTVARTDTACPSAIGASRTWRPREDGAGAVRSGGARRTAPTASGRSDAGAPPGSPLAVPRRSADPSPIGTPSRSASTSRSASASWSASASASASPSGARSRRGRGPDRDPVRSTGRVRGQGRGWRPRRRAPRRARRRAGRHRPSAGRTDRAGCDGPARGPRRGGGRPASPPIARRGPPPPQRRGTASDRPAGPRRRPRPPGATPRAAARPGGWPARRPRWPSGSVSPRPARGRRRHRAGRSGSPRGHRCRGGGRRRRGGAAPRPRGPSTLVGAVTSTQSPKRSSSCGRSSPSSGFIEPTSTKRAGWRCEMPSRSTRLLAGRRRRRAARRRGGRRAG